MDRLDRINQTIRREIGCIIQRELQDPRLSFVSITQVQVSRDLQHAKVYFSVLGDRLAVEKAEAGLNEARGIVRKMIGRNVRMRYTPQIEFIFDESLGYAAKIEQTLREIKSQINQE